MFAAVRIPMAALTAALLFSDLFAIAGQSATLTIRNESNRVIVLQETIVQNGEVKRLRPIRLLPGESVKQPDSMPGNRSFELFDGQSPTVPLWSGKVCLGDGNRTIVVSSDAKGFTLREDAPSPAQPRKK
jgi:hypothetical protein